MSKPLRIALYALPLLLFVGLAVLLGSRLGTDPTALPSARLGKPMPAFSLAALEDPLRQVSVEDIKGQVTVLNVWATWCISCQVEHPVLMEMARQGITIIKINYKNICKHNQNSEELRIMTNNHMVNIIIQKLKNKYSNI